MPILPSQTLPKTDSTLPNTLTHSLHIATQLLSATEARQISQLKQALLDKLNDTEIAYFCDKEYAALFTVLKTYYEQSPLKDDPLCRLLTQIKQLITMVNVIKSILTLRWQTEPPQLFAERIKTKPPFDNHDHLLQLGIDCRSLSEAALVADFLEAVLASNYGVHYRTGHQFGTVEFCELETPEGVSVYLHYMPTCYALVTHCNPDYSKVADKALIQAFCDAHADYDDYHIKKYSIQDTRGLSPSRICQHTAVDTVKKTLFAGSGIQTTPQEKLTRFKGRILCVTSIVLGAGNYMNAYLTVEGLCKTMPNIQIDWILADNGMPIPSTRSLPSQVTLYQHCELWKLYPLIRSLSLEADMILGLPDNFLWFCERQILSTALNLSDRACYVLINEYNYNYNRSGLPPYSYVSLDSGIGGLPPHSLGIIHPQTVLFGESLGNKRTDLYQHPKIRTLFSIGTATDPMYFGYVYAPKKAGHEIKGLTILEVFAIFVMHAKLRHSHSCYIVLPLTPEHIMEACERYSSIFQACSIHYTNTAQTVVFHNGASQYTFHVVNLFPWSNLEFRALMNYAAAYDTPVVATGDQSIIELFFSMTEGFIFLYQLLCHKKPLFDQLVSITNNAGLCAIKELLKRSLHTRLTASTHLNEEDYLKELAEYIIIMNRKLKRESLLFMSLIKSQPNLIESLSQAICASVHAQREMTEASSVTPQDKPFARSHSPREGLLFFKPPTNTITPIEPPTSLGSNASP